MKSKSDLFSLIKAMSKSEKRYFTLDAQKAGRKKSKYLELFQLINEMEVYNEEPLKKRFAKNLPSDKNYLYEAILRSMRDYRSSKSKAAQVKEMILDANYLYGRGLYNQCKERLIDAQELAGQLADQFSLLEITKERLKLTLQTKKGNYEEEIERLIHQKDQNITSINDELKYLDIGYKLMMDVLEYSELENDEAKEELTERFPLQLFQEDQEPQQGQARRRFFQSRALYYQLLGNFDQVFSNYSKVVSWWDEHPKYKEEEFSRYIVDISNLLSAYYKKRKYEFIPELLNKLEQEKPKSIHDKKVVFQKSSLYRLIYHINVGVQEGADKLVGDIENGFQTYKLSPVTQLIISFNVALLFFILERYKECKEWAIRIIREYKQVSSQDIHKGAHFLSLIASFESDDIDDFDASMRSLNRFFLNRGLKNKEIFELKIRSYFKQLSNAPRRELASIYLEMEAYLKDLINNPEETIFLGLDELILGWVQSKRTQKPMTEILKKAV